MLIASQGIRDLFRINQSCRNQPSQAPPSREQTAHRAAAARWSIRGTLRRWHAAGVSANDALGTLRKVRVTPVFTAHPTEVARRTVLLKRGRIAQHLANLDHLPLAVSDAAEYEALIQAEITSLWQTDEVRVERPLVTDEIRMGLDVYPMSIFESLPRVYEEIINSFQEVYGVTVETSELPSCSNSVPGLVEIVTGIHS
jgi:phosphoenolpyruvate carboxylase